MPAAILWAFVPDGPEASSRRPLFHFTEWETETEGLGGGGGKVLEQGSQTSCSHFLRGLFVFVGFLIVLGFGGARDQTQVLEPARQSPYH